MVVQRRVRAVVTDKTRATIIDHVINQGLSLREAGERVQPNLCRSAVASIIWNFQQTNRTQRLPTSGRRGKLLSEDQEHAIVGLVIADNVIKLREIQTRIVEDNLVFHNVESISLTTIARTLTKHRVQMKQLSIVPFERNSERVKELRHQYIQRVMEVEANQSPHEIIYVEEAGFNLAKTCWRGRNVIGKRATVDVPGQRGEKYQCVLQFRVLVWSCRNARLVSTTLSAFFCLQMTSTNNWCQKQKGNRWEQT
ncbi:uncharacterized protein LOC122878265 [Siniperca chuatsi]|uniref:uncharacterized protein LOC122878265 n=1 Tax=Siniperca chuatsi TaxID=119488 RepID=UPI001CE1C9DA|nr:uncharacterized protein LOC122878265 [Siniperca chuatsi]